MQSSFALTEVDDEASVADAHFELAADCASKSAASSGAMWETLLSLLPSNFLQPATRPYLGIRVWNEDSSIRMSRYFMQLA